MQSTEMVPEEVKGLNWGAFFLNWIWAINNQVWIRLAALIPCVNLVVAIYLLVKGNELAWSGPRQWQSVEQFKATQGAWTKWGVGVFIASIVLNVVYFILMMALGLGSAAARGGG